MGMVEASGFVYTYFSLRPVGIKVGNYATEDQGVFATECPSISH